MGSPMAVEYLIDGQRKRIVQHSRKQLLQHWRGLLNTWVGIDFDEPRAAVFIKHEIIAEYLKTVASLLFIDLPTYTQGSQFDYILDSRHEFFETSASTFDQLPQSLKR